MTYTSILFRQARDRAAAERDGPPAFFADLNLDQVVAAITAGREEYDLAPLFHIPLNDADSVIYRHELMRDLDAAALSGQIKRFAQAMRATRDHLARTEKTHYQRQKERWFLDAVNVYCDAVTRLAGDLRAATLESRGLAAFRDYVIGYAASERFRSLAGQAKTLAAALAALRYAVLIRGPRVEVRRCDGEPDYSAEVEATFERFHQADVGAYAFKFADAPEMNHVEARILDLVAQLHHDIFSQLATFRAANFDFLDPAVVAFDREVQFPIAYLDYIAGFKTAGLKFCYPRVSPAHKAIYARDSFDLALAGKLIACDATPVANDFYLEDLERIIVVTGPNQGGKTTFARVFGQLHYLASLGCPVPGSDAQLYLCDRLFTHFERQERTANLRGKLQDDLVRIHDILDRATPRSIIVINEIFASTTLRDAVFLSRKIAAAIMRLDLLCVWVTFIDELASAGETTVSMVSTLAPDDPARRTFKLVRRPADGLAHAMAIAERHGLTYDLIRERIGS